MAYAGKWLAEKTWPKNKLDHDNGIRDDNRWSNLREATNVENSRNRTRLSKRNSSGVHGVHWEKSKGKWRAEISVDGKTIFLGNFVELSDAATARREAEKKYFGEFSPKISEQELPSG